MEVENKETKETEISSDDQASTDKPSGSEIESKESA
jgi:hypothetical protein